MSQHKWLYIFLIPGFLYLIIFKYIPMAGVLIAFQDFSLVRGITGSSWVGLENFEYLIQAPDFYKVLRNSIVLSVYQIAFGFPAPIILAIMLNEVRNLRFKQISQTVLYLPHFISWVVLAGIVMNFLSPSTGIVNEISSPRGMSRLPFYSSPNISGRLLFPPRCGRE